MITHRNSLDICPGGVPLFIRLSQYDSSFTLIFDLFSHKGTFTVESGTTARFRELKPDGNAISIDATISGTTVTLAPSQANAQQMTAIAGNCKCELSLFKGDKELNTANFTLLIEKAVIDKDTPYSDSVIRELVDVIDRTDELIEAADNIEHFIDPSLTIQGRAADAKTVGEKFDGLDALIDQTASNLLGRLRGALLDCFEHVAWVDEDGDDYYSSLSEALSNQPETYSTVLYTDGRLIINERSSRRISNIQVHGPVVKEYYPYSDTDHYIFTVGSSYPITSTAYWFNDRALITSVEIGSKITPPYLRGWFTGLTNCTRMLLNNLDVSEVRDARRAFTDCSSMTEFPATLLKFTSNLSDALGMFSGCSSLIDLDLSLADFRAVYTLTDMFRGCSNLENIVLPDLKNNRLNNLTGTMFTFFGCSKLSSIDLSRIDMSKTTNLRGFFNGCSSLLSIDLSGLDITSLVNTQEMFYQCSELKTIYSDRAWNGSAITNSTNMFNGCSKLVGGNGTTYSSSYIDKTRARIDGGFSSPGYFTSKV